MTPEERDVLWNVHKASFLQSKMLQHWADLALWEQFLNAHEDIQSLIEIGTYLAGMSKFLALQALQRGMDFRTVDTWDPSPYMRSAVCLMLDLPGRFTKMDVFTDERFADMLDRAKRPLLLYCDGGDKPREMATFVPKLAAGDYVATHDWGIEIHPRDVEGLDVEPLVLEECEELSSITRFWGVR